MARKILILTYWSFKDPLIQTYTLPYVKLIQKSNPGGICFLVTLEKDESKIEPSQQVEIKNQLLAEGISWRPFQYHAFGFRALLTWSVIILGLSIFVIRRRIDVIHCWCTPAGAAGYILSMLTSRPLILDSYEPHAEAMVENGTWKKESLSFKLLFWLEKKQTHRASAVIAGAEGMREYAIIKYQLDVQNFYVKPACVDLVLFSQKNIKKENLLKQFGFTDKIVGVYAGKLGGIYLEQEVFDLLKEAVNFWGETFRFLLLSNIDQRKVNEYCAKAGIDPRLVTVAFVDHADVPDYMGLADFAITPVKSVPTKRYCTPIKNGEYWALGLPVIITPDISDDSGIIEQHGVGAVLKALEKVSYGEAVNRIDQILKLPKAERFQKIRGIAETYRSFEIAEKVYEKMYADRMVE